MFSWFGGLSEEVGDMTSSPQMKTYWKLMCGIAIGMEHYNNEEITNIIVTEENLKEFILHIEDPVWRERNVLHTNLVNLDEAKTTTTYQILQGVNQIKEKLGI